MQEAHKTFKIYYSTVSKWLNRTLTQKHLIAKHLLGYCSTSKINWEELEADIKENPDLTQAEYGEHFGVSRVEQHTQLK